jgi:hypothetical protein
VSYQSRWDSGDWITICDACGKKYKASQLRKRWDGLMVCSYDFEIRQPQDFVRGAVDKIAIPWARTEASDEFIAINYTTSIEEPNTLIEDFSTAVSKIVPNDVVITPDRATDEGLGLSFLGKYSIAGSGTASGYSHTLGLSEVIVSVLTKNIVITETLSLSETEIKAVSKVSSEAVVLTEVELKAAGKTLAETSNLSETSFKTISKTILETTTISESFVSDLLINKSLGSQYLGKTTLG